jgi:putative endonuclease
LRANRKNFVTDVGRFTRNRPLAAQMTIARRRMGQLAEDLAAERLAARGWEILERNARTRYGELDLVASDGRALVFVEVKAGRLGSPHGPERPVEAIDHRKQRQVRRLAAAWLAERPGLPYWAEIRFDAIGVSFGPAGQVAGFEHIENAF